MIKQITITRESTCMGDDVLAPHEISIEVDSNISYVDLFKNIISRKYLPSIKENDVIWLLTYKEIDLVRYSTSKNEYNLICSEKIINHQQNNFHIKYFSSPNAVEKLEKYLNSKNISFK